MPPLTESALRFQSRCRTPPSPTTDFTFATSASASASGTYGLPRRAACCHCAHTLTNVGVFPASSFAIESRIRSSKGRVSPHSGSDVSKRRRRCELGDGGPRRRGRGEPNQRQDDLPGRKERA